MAIGTRTHLILARSRDNGKYMTRGKYIIGLIIVLAMLSGCASQKKPKTAMQSESITLQATVLFDFDKYTFREDAKPLLDDVAQRMKANPLIYVVVEGHTDSVGSAAYNEVLAEKRARAVGAYLSQSGVQYNRITFISKGKREPKDPRHTNEANSVNRRAEIYNH